MDVTGFTDQQLIEQCSKCLRWNMSSNNRQYLSKTLEHWTTHSMITRAQRQQVEIILWESDKRRNHGNKKTTRT